MASKFEAYLNPQMTEIAERRHQDEVSSPEALLAR
jgi:hypothetical protein